MTGFDDPEMILYSWQDVKSSNQLTDVNILDKLGWCHLCVVVKTVAQQDINVVFCSTTKYL